MSVVVFHFMSGLLENIYNKINNNKSEKGYSDKATQVNTIMQELKLNTQQILRFSL